MVFLFFRTCYFLCDFGYGWTEDGKIYKQIKLTCSQNVWTPRQHLPECKCKYKSAKNIYIFIVYFRTYEICKILFSERVPTGMISLEPMNLVYIKNNVFGRRV